MVKDEASIWDTVIRLRDSHVCEKLPQKYIEDPA